MKLQTDTDSSAQTRKTEVQKAKDKFMPMVDQASKRRDASVLAARNEVAKQLQDMEKKRDAANASASAWQKDILPKVKRRAERELQAVQDRFDSSEFESHCLHDKAREELERTWNDGLAAIRAPMADSGRAVLDWKETNWDQWIPPKQFAETIRFGEIQVDMKKLVEQAAPEGKFSLPIPDAFSLPALLAFPRQSSLMISTDPSGRKEALETLQLVMVRLLTCMPPGRSAS